MGSNKHMRAEFDAFLEEESLLEEDPILAIKRVLAYMIKQAIQAKHLSNKTMDGEIRKKYPLLNQLLDPKDASVKLDEMLKMMSLINTNPNFSVH